MTDKVFDPFYSEEIPSRGYLASRLWAQDILDISECVRNVVSDFMNEVCEEDVRGIDLVAAWITAIQANPDTKQLGLHFPTTSKGYPLFPIIIEEMELEQCIRQAALAFYEIADQNYNPRPF